MGRAATRQFREDDLLRERGLKDEKMHGVLKRPRGVSGKTLLESGAAELQIERRILRKSLAEDEICILQLHRAGYLPRLSED